MEDLYVNLFTQLGDITQNSPRGADFCDFQRSIYISFRSTVFRKC